MNTLVVPTARPEGLVEFLDAWRPWPWDAAVVIEDAPELSLDPDELAPLADGKPVGLHSWAEIEAALPDPSIISRRDSAIRAFGFWEAWRDGAETILTLDDDCFPADDDLVRGHLDNLERTPAFETTVPGLRVRGLPYREQGRLEGVCVSIGLWSGNPDLDAVQTLASGAGASDEGLVRRALTRVLPSGQYFPVSGMNLAVRRQVACLMYYPPMGQGSPYRRFDDIWCGLVLQRVCRHLDLRIVCGRPLVEHRRASDPLANLEKEAGGIGANEAMWRVVDSVPLEATSPLACMREMGAGLERAGAGEYVESWGRGIQEWCELFREA